MGKVFILFIAFALISTALTDEDEPCVSESTLLCARSTDSLFRESPFLSDEILTNNCSDIQRSYDCAVDIIRSCHREQLDNFLLETTSLKELIDDLCIETSPVREAYRQHVSCFASLDVERGLSNCAMTVGETARRQLEEEGREIQSEEEGYEFACSFYQPFKECLTQAVDDKCEEGAGDTLGELLDQATELPREKICKSVISELEDAANSLLEGAANSLVEETPNSVFEDVGDEVVELFKRRK